MTCNLCDNEKLVARGMCSKHYDQWRYQNIRSQSCTVEGCNTRRNSSTGYCGFHYTSLRVLGDPEARGMAGEFCKNGHQDQYKVYANGHKVCMECMRIKDRIRNKTTERQSSMKALKLKSKYGLTLEQYYDMWEAQDNKCAICKKELTEGKAGAHVDHDHKCCEGKTSCGKCIRGILCADCNNLIARAKEDEKILASAIEYLKEWNPN